MLRMASIRYFITSLEVCEVKSRLWRAEERETGGMMSPSWELLYAPRHPISFSLLSTQAS